MLLLEAKNVASALAEILFMRRLMRFMVLPFRAGVVFYGMDILPSSSKATRAGRENCVKNIIKGLYRGISP